MDKDKNTRQKWSHDARASTSAWERALRPNGSSLWLLVLLLVAACVFLGLAFWTAIQDANLQEQEQARAAAEAAPAISESGSSTNDTRSSSWPREPVAASGVPQAPEPRSQQISKCVSRAGAASYSDGPCPAGTFTSVVTVRPDTNVVDGMSREARQASIDRNATEAQRPPQYEKQIASNDRYDPSPVAAECARLGSAISAIDAAARQPRPASEQDRLKAERMRLRDRHFTLRCT